MQRILPPMEEGGRFFLNLALTTLLDPCARVTLPKKYGRRCPSSWSWLLVHAAQLLAGVVGSLLIAHVLELDERRVVGLVRAGTVDGEARGVGVSVRFERGGMVRPRTVRLAHGSSSLEPPAPRRATPDAERSARRGSPSGGNATVASSPRGVGWTPCGHANVARPSWG